MVCALAGCRSTTISPLPPPLPEALPWVVPAQGGAFLGLDTEENSGDSLDALTFEPGVRVVTAVENSPAARAGVTPGDVVLALDERPVDDPGALQALVHRAGAGARVVLSVRRDDTVFDVPVELAGTSGAGEPPEPRYRLDPVRSRAGWATDVDGVRLVTSDESGPFPAAGLAVGSVVTALDGETVVSDRELIRRLATREPGQRVTVRARTPDGREVEQRVRLHAQPTRVTEFGLGFFVFGVCRYESKSDGSGASFSLLDLWVVELFQYRRDQQERRWVLLELFGYDVLPFATGVGALAE